VDAWSCYSLCVPVRAASDSEASGDLRKALAGMAEIDNQTRASVLFQALNSCVRMEEVEILELLFLCGGAREPWQLLLGARAAIKALSVLLPTAFALMSGTIRGAIVAKLVIPYSRIPALILACAVGYSLPHFLLLIILLKNFIGDLTLLPAVLAFVFSMVVFLPWQRLAARAQVFGAEDLTNPLTHEEAQASIGIRQKLQMCLTIICVVFFAVWLAQWANFLLSVAATGLFNIDTDDVRGLLRSASFWRALSVAGLTAVCNFYGVAKIAGVCFADAVLFNLLLVDEANVDAGAQSAEFLTGARNSRGSSVTQASNPRRNDRQVIALFAELHKGLLCREPVTRREFVCPKCNHESGMERVGKNETFVPKSQQKRWEVRAGARERAAGARDRAVKAFRQTFARSE